MEGTGALRGAAARWTLAGDQQLLDLLQEIHQRIITKCNETNKRLEEMSRGLRDASVNLQNVNNKFLALSNTQFVESRVYDDDADVTPPTADKEQPKAPDLTPDLSKLKESLQVLESYHEPLLIVGESDSGSDSDDNEDRLVLKPRDLYADRPLPHIIGSQAWRSKWHAGLVLDESDSDSSTCKVEEVEQYSDSEDERATAQEYRSPARDLVSASKASSGSASPPAVASPAASLASPAAVAAELARRLGGDTRVPEREVSTEPETVIRKLYRPQEPLATTIFPDEPPPLDDTSSDDDIFAELHKTQPKPHSSKVDDLFDFKSKPTDLEEALFGPSKAQTNQRIEEPPLFPEDSEPEVTETPKTVATEQPNDSFKKPVGGISLFGTNKHAESIGAAILKRNRRKSSTSGDESNTEEVNVVKESKPAKEVQEVKKERDIFDDLFAKSEKLNNKNATPEVKTRDVVKPAVVQIKEVKKKDMFSDIFDDIDDIFSSDIVNVQVKETKKNEKSLFSDDDDLFAEISKVNKDNGKDKVATSEKSLFADVTPKVEKDKSNEKGLFADVAPKVDENNIKTENKVFKGIKESPLLFDSDSDDGLFTNVTKYVKQDTRKTEKPVEYKLTDDLFDGDEDDGLFAKNISAPKVEVSLKSSKVTELSKKTLFDSDDELFKHTKDDNNEQFVDKSEKKETDTPDILSPVKIQSDELKSKEVPENATVIDNIKNDILDDAVPPLEDHKESTPGVSHDRFDDDESYTTNVIAKHYTNEPTVLTQNKKTSENISDTFDKPNEQTVFKDNILRTTRIASDDDNVPPEPQSQDVYNDSDDDLFRIKPKIPNINHNNNQKEQTSKNPESFTKPSDKNDIFSDIFDDVPPVFEKPKEPKKSKNVNALFDDDSDDEALFFKKNDVITDEKPEFSHSDERFGIFNEEPPAIDVDFIQKPSKKEEVVHPSQKSDDILPTLVKTGKVSPIPIKSDNIVEKSAENDNAVSQEGQDATDNTSQKPNKIGKLKPMNININVNSLLPGASPKKKQIEKIDIKQEQTASNEELHRTVKIESKMVKSISFDDPELLDNKISKERAKIQVKRRPSTRRARKEAVRKSAIDLTDSSFNSSNDNSTKEEVKEKIVKTVYILNDDDIFGTSNTNNESTERAKKHLNIVDSDEELFKTPDLKTDIHVKLTNDYTPTTAERKSSVVSDDNNSIFKPSNATDIAKDEIECGTKVTKEGKTHLATNENVEISNDKQVKQIINESVFKESIRKPFLVSDDDDDFFKQTNKKPSPVNIINDPDIDSDEELFRNAPKSKTNQILKEKKTLPDLDDDHLYKTKEIKPVLKPNLSSDEEDLFRNKGIGTLGKVYKAEDRKVQETHNIFDDFPPAFNVVYDLDTDVSQSKVTVKETIEDKTVKDEKVKKSILDDSSDEEDLFKTKTKLMNKKNKSLFGDDDDVDDLFGTKSVKEVKPAAPVAPPAKEPKAAEPVFVDPLSLFGDDD